MKLEKCATHVVSINHTVYTVDELSVPIDFEKEKIHLIHRGSIIIIDPRCRYPVDPRCIYRSYIYLLLKKKNGKQ